MTSFETTKSNEHVVSEMSRVDIIVQHIQKNKKVQLPKEYVRNPKVYQLEYEDLEDELQSEHVIMSNVSASASVNVFEPSPQVIEDTVVVYRKERKKAKKTTNNVEKRPSAYNMFVKDTVQKLADSHKHMGRKERFQLAIQMWNEHKNKDAMT